MNPLDRAKSACAALRRSGTEIVQTIDRATDVAASAASSHAEAVRPIRQLKLRQTANLQTWLADFSFQRTVSSRDAELCIRLDSSSIREQLLAGLDLPPSDISLTFSLWSDGDEPWGDSASLVVEFGGGRLDVPLGVSIDRSRLSIFVAGPPLFTGSSISQTLFANMLSSKALFGTVRKVDLPALKLSASESNFQRAHVRKGAVRIFNQVNQSGSSELSPLALDSKDFTLFLAPEFLQRLLASLAGIPVRSLRVVPQLRSLEFETGGSKSKGINLVCEIEVTVTVTVRVRLDLQFGNVINAYGAARSSRLSWDLDGVCSIAYDVARGIARALGEDIRDSINIPTDRNPISKSLRCQGVRLLALDWRPGGVGIHFRRASGAGDLSCV